MARTAFVSKKTISKPSDSKKTIPKPSLSPPRPSPQKLSLKKPLLTKSARKHSMAVQKPTIVSTPINKPKFRRKSAVLTQIKYFQNYTNLLVSKLPFSRMVREIILNSTRGGESYRFTRTSLLAIQEAFEAFIVSLFEDANHCAVHANRVTLFMKDIDLVKKISKQQW